MEDASLELNGLVNGYDDKAAIMDASTALGVAFGVVDDDEAAAGGLGAGAGGAGGGAACTGGGGGGGGAGAGGALGAAVDAEGLGEKSASRFEMPGMFLRWCGRLAAEPPDDCSSFSASWITALWDPETTKQNGGVSFPPSIRLVAVWLIELQTKAV